MPLAYDDIPGSWGAYSRKWPKLTFQTEDEALRAFIACTKANVVPYGAYVKCDLELRCETEELRNKLAVWLAECPQKTYSDLRARFIAEGRW